MNPFRRHVVLIHPPSVYDFRRTPGLYGPISDVVPSHVTFEMYPVGLTSIADTLERAGYNVMILNAAARMLHDPGFDLEQAVAGLRPRLFGIDLHWLPHAHGSIEVARLLKRLHPDIPIVFGGLTASYYHEELVRYPEVDFVLRGDSTEEPALALVRALGQGARADLGAVPNLTWKRPDGTVAVNPLSHVPDSLDYTAVPGYRYAIRSALKYGSVQNVMPYLGWWDYPIAALLTARGCAMECAVCGGSRPAYRRICGRHRPAFRSPEALAADVALIRRFTRGPIFVIHDIRMAGPAYARRFLGLLKEQRLDNELVLELFYPAGTAFFQAVAAAAPRFSLQLTLESHDPAIRQRNGKFPYSNAAVAATIAAALRQGCRHLDLFFMVGLPGQTPASALGAVDYCRDLLDRFGAGGRLRFFSAPLAPFLDPGSRAFEHPEQFGYRRLRRTLAEHRQALLAPSWKWMLNYETTAMDRAAIVDTTYALALGLVRLKARYGLIPADAAARMVARIHREQALLAEVDAAMADADPGARARRLAAVWTAATYPLEPATVGSEEMRWTRGRRLFRVAALAGLLLAVAGEELRALAHRLVTRPG